MLGFFWGGVSTINKNMREVNNLLDDHMGKIRSCFEKLGMDYVNFTMRWSSVLNCNWGQLASLKFCNTAPISIAKPWIREWWAFKKLSNSDFLTRMSWAFLLEHYLRLDPRPGVWFTSAMPLSSSITRVISSLISVSLTDRPRSVRISFTRSIAKSSYSRHACQVITFVMSKSERGDLGDQTDQTDGDHAVRFAANQTRRQSEAGNVLDSFCLESRSEK